MTWHLKWLTYAHRSIIIATPWAFPAQAATRALVTIWQNHTWQWLVSLISIQNHSPLSILNLQPVCSVAQKSDSCIQVLLCLRHAKVGCLYATKFYSVSATQNLQHLHYAPSQTSTCCSKRMSNWYWAAPVVELLHGNHSHLRLETQRLWPFFDGNRKERRRLWAPFGWDQASPGRTFRFPRPSGWTAPGLQRPRATQTPWKRVWCSKAIWYFWLWAKSSLFIFSYGNQYLAVAESQSCFTQRLHGGYNPYLVRILIKTIPLGLHRLDREVAPPWDLETHKQTPCFGKQCMWFDYQSLAPENGLGFEAQLLGLAASHEKTGSGSVG